MAPGGGGDAVPPVVSGVPAGAACGDCAVRVAAWAGTALQPDVLVAWRDDLFAVEGGKFLGQPPVLAVEVLSPSTRRIDRLSKLSAYEEAGVASYWLVNPDPETPSLHALDLVDGRYVEVGCPSGEQAWQAQRPFPVTIRPAELLAGLRRSP